MTKRQIVPHKQWKAASLDERELLAPAVAHAAPVDVVVKNDDGEPTERTLGWTISTETRDRDGDRISLKGWDLKNYKKSPVVPWAHDYKELPVAKCISISIDKEKGRLYAVKQFTTREQNPFGAMVYELAKEKFLNTASVGFIPRDYTMDEPTEGEDEKSRIGFFHKKQELLESSIVVVPSNPAALQSAKSEKGIDLSPFVSWAEKILDGEMGAGIWTPRKQVEELFLVIAPPKPTVIVPDALEAAPAPDGEPAGDERGVAVVAGPDATADNVITPAKDVIDELAAVVDGQFVFVKHDDAKRSIVIDPMMRALMQEVAREVAKEAIVAVLKDLGITKSVDAPAAGPATPTEAAPSTDGAQASAPADEVVDLDSLFVLSQDDEREAEPDNNTDDIIILEPEELRAQVAEVVRQVIGAPSRAPAKEPA